MADNSRSTTPETAPDEDRVEPGGPPSETSDPETDAPATGLPARIGRIVGWVMKRKIVRVFLTYASKTGPLMAFGLAYQAIFAVFAGLWVGFSIIGLVLAQDIGLRNSLIDAIAAAVPGLIDPGDGSGAVDPSVLLESSALSWTGAVALAGLLFTALGFLASARDAVRRIFDVAPPTTNFLLLKLKDLGLAVGFGVALIVSTVLSTASTTLLGFVLDLIGIGSDSVIGTVLGTILGLLIVLALDTAVLAALYRILAGIPIPRPHLFAGALLGAVGLGALKALGNTLLGGASSNPLLASFAIIIGLLIFFNLVCQVILISAAWISVGMTDEGIAADPVAAEAERLEKERIVELERIAAEARQPFFARLFRRDPRRESGRGGSGRGEKVGGSK